MIGLIHRFFKGLAVLGAVSFGFAALATIADIILRITGVGLRGVVDYVQLFVMSGAFLAMPYTFLVQGHVRVELVLDMLSSPLRKVMAVAASVLVLGMVASLTASNYDGLMRVIESNDISLNIGLPMAYYWAPVVLGLGLSILAVLVLIYEILTNKTI